MDLHVKVHHNQKHQIYRQVSFTFQESIPISYRHQLQEFCQWSALLILPMGLFPFHKIILPCWIPWPLPPFSLIRNFWKHPRKRFQNFRQSYMLSTDRIEIHQSQPASMTKRRCEGHTRVCDWWISIRSVDNTLDWRKFWKRFRGCFVFQGAFHNAKLTG